MNCLRRARSQVSGGQRRVAVESPAAVVTFLLAAAVLAAQPAPALTIVVLEGEGGVNIKVSVPLIDVDERDAVALKKKWGSRRQPTSPTLP